MNEERTGKCLRQVESFVFKGIQSFKIDFFLILLKVANTGKHWILSWMEENQTATYFLHFSYLRMILWKNSTAISIKHRVLATFKKMFIKKRHMAHNQNIDGSYTKTTQNGGFSKLCVKIKKICYTPNYAKGFDKGKIVNKLHCILLTILELYWLYFFSKKTDMKIIILVSNLKDPIA
jgi:hypothetical protein